jgi:hypothetical protein
MIRSCLSLLALAWVVLPQQPLLAQSAPSCAPTADPWEYLRRCAHTIVPGDTTTLPAAFRQAFDNLKSPATINSALGELSARRSRVDLVRDLNLHFVNVQEGASQNLGLHYDWTHHAVRSPHRQGATHWGYTAGVEAKGLAVAVPSRNPEDFLESAFTAHGFFGSGGAIDTAVVARQLAALGDSISQYGTLAALQASPSLTPLMGAIWDSLSTQVYVTFGPEARFETNQRFDHRAWALGARVGFDLKAWNPRSTLARLNIFDWPAALVRYATGTDARVTPSGAAFPTLMVTLHRVSPGADPTREALAGLDPYSRFSLSMAYRSRLMESATGPIWLDAEFRHFTELSPSPAVSAADRHRFNRLYVVVEGPGGLTASWATGGLPLSESDADRWGLGFRVHF